MNDFTAEIHNVYFTDLNGDEVPEVCFDMKVGSGIIRHVVKVYDYAAGELYSLKEPPSNYCSLLEEDDRLLVRYPVRIPDEFLTAPLALEEQNGEICLVMKGQRIDGVVSFEESAGQYPNEESSEEVPLDESVVKWFGWQDVSDVKDIALEEYPGRTFTVVSGDEIYAVNKYEEKLLFRATQIAGAYFLDLNGDGRRELLIRYTKANSTGSYVGVYDLYWDKKYDLGMDGRTSYWLEEQNGFLYLTASPWHTEPPRLDLGHTCLVQERHDWYGGCCRLRGGRDVFPCGQNALQDHEGYIRHYLSLHLVAGGRYLYDNVQYC